MRKLFILSAVLLSAFYLTAQNGVSGNDAQNKANTISKKVDKVINRSVVVPSPGSKEIPTGEPIGFTNYDLQTNASAARRMVKHADGTISAVWTQYQGTVMPDATQRGTGYNFFDGSSWLYTTESGNVRIEKTTRTGWPALVETGNGRDYVINHARTTGYYGWYQNIGASNTNWTAAPVAAAEPLLWPRMAAAGNYVYSIGVVDYDVTYNNQSPAPVFMRSTDNGATWSAMTQLPGSTSEYFNGWGGDSYAIDARDNFVAVALFENFSDLAVWKSEDYGVTWTKTIVWDFPIDKFDIETGTTGVIDMNGDQTVESVVGPDGNGDVVIDSNGKVHIVFGRMRFVDDNTADGGLVSWFPYSDYILYWNEGMGAGKYTSDAIIPFASVDNPFAIDSLNIPLAVDTIGWVPDLDASGELEFVSVNDGEYPFGFYGLEGMSTMPSLAIDANDNLYCVYSTVMEGGDYLWQDAVPNAAQFRHSWVTRYNGESWGSPVLISGVDGMNAECVYNVTARNVDDNLYVYYMWDQEPGSYMTEDTDGEPVTDNVIVFKAVPVSEIPVSDVKTATVTLSTVCDGTVPVNNAEVTFAYGSKSTGAGNTVVFTNLPISYDMVPYTFSYTAKIGSMTTNGTVQMTGEEVSHVIDFGACETVDTKHIVNNAVSIYPNPAHDKLFVSNAENSSVRIVNILGVEVLNTFVQNSQIDISQLRSGTYFVIVNTKEGSVSNKLVVE